MQEYLESATASFFGNDLRIRKLWKNSEGYRHGKSEQGFSGSAVSAEIVDNHGQPRRSGVSCGSARRGRQAQRNDDLDHLGWLPGTLIIEADRARGAVLRDAPETVGTCDAIKLEFERGDQGCIELAAALNGQSDENTIDGAATRLFGGTLWRGRDLGATASSGLCGGQHFAGNR